jgi:dimethylhistidine N-methyltransferase
MAGAGPRLVFYPGSSIGNFSPAQALAFVRQARQLSEGGGLLIGVDLVKSLDVLEPAYDDALGVTAAFNRNMLLHTNRLLRSNFDVSQWQHRAFFNPRESRIEMHLDAVQDLTVQWGGVTRDFRRGESIHTENSYKYTPAAFETLLREAGYSRINQWRDPKDWFAVFLAQD